MTRENYTPSMEQLDQADYKDIGRQYVALVDTYKSFMQKLGDPIQPRTDIYEWGFGGISLHDYETDELKTLSDFYLKLENAADIDSQDFAQCVVSLYSDRKNLKDSLFSNMAFKLNPKTDGVKDFRTEGHLVDWKDILSSTNELFQRKLSEQK